jgi:Domain of unknown function (DUF6378)/Domain of unknown function (DUF1937)
MDAKTPAGALLLDAAEAVDGARNTTHGDKERSFQAIAAMWTAYLSQRRDGAGAPIRPHDVAHLMVLLKQQRAEWGTPVREHFLDAAGYSAVGGALASVGAELKKAPEPASGTKFFYLASPYRRHPHGVEAAWELAKWASKTLISQWIPIFSPILSSHWIAGAAPVDPNSDLSFWLIQDLPLLRLSAGLIILTPRGWQDSEGIKAEREEALVLNLPIFYWDPHTEPVEPLIQSLKILLS